MRLTRRSFLKTGTLAVPALIVPALPAAAQHVAEPVAPITGVDLHVYEYGTGINIGNTRTQGPIVLNQVTSAINARIDLAFTAPSAPSEHWRVRIEVAKGPYRLLPDGSGLLGVDWTSSAHHQNIPPHAKIPWRSNHITNQRNLPQAPEWTIRYEVWTDESDAYFERVVHFFTEG